MNDRVSTYNQNKTPKLTSLDELAEGELSFRLATGNVGVMAATNDVGENAQMPILIMTHAVIIPLSLFTFITFS